MIKLASLSIIFLILASTPLIFAQEETEEFSAIEYIDPLFRPTQEGLKAFYVGFGETAPKIIATLFLLLIGVAVSFAFKRGIKYGLKLIFSIPLLKATVNIDPDDIGKKATKGWVKLVNVIPEMFFWFIFAFFFILGLDTLGLEQASDALTQFWIFFPRLIAALVFLVAGFIFERIVIAGVEGSTSPYYGKDSGIKIPIQVIIYSIVIAIAVTRLGLDEQIVPILVWVIGIGIMGGFAIAFGLGGRFFVVDLVSLWSLNKLGIKANATVEYDIGGSIGKNIDKIKGKIIDMSTTHIKMEEGDGDNKKIFTIPTQSIFGQKVTILEEAPENETMKKVKKKDEKK